MPGNDRGVRRVETQGHARRDSLSASRDAAPHSGKRTARQCSGSHDDTPADDLSPRWSPDSAAISFVSWRDGNAEVYVTESKRAVQEFDTLLLAIFVIHPRHDTMRVDTTVGLKTPF